MTMDERKRRRPFGFGFDDDFFGGEFERMREEMEEMMEKMMHGMPQDEIRKLSQKRGSQVYGFSLRVGPDGKPVVTEFGDIPRKQAQDVRALEVGEAQGTGEGEAREAGGRKQEADEREPLVDVFKDKKGVNVIAEMPGVGEKEVQLSVDGKTLEIRAEGARKYYRKVELPEDVSKKKMEKKYRNGVLELVFS